MMIWLAFAVLVCLTVVIIARPLFRQTGGHGILEHDLEVYAAQLGELDDDVKRGILQKEEGEASRVEIARKLLHAKRISSAQTAKISYRRQLKPLVLFAGLAGLTSIGSAAIYLSVGNPDLPDMPLSARLNVPLDAQPVEFLIARVEERLKQEPQDARGWAVIAPIYLRRGRFQDAAQAFRHAMQLSGETVENLLGLGEALTYANSGTVTAEGKQSFDRVLTLDPKSVRARFWLGMHAEQRGEKNTARTLYQAMLNDPGVPEHWKAVVSNRMTILQGEAFEGADASRNQPLDAEKAAPIMALQKDAQMQAIRGMVEGLAERLKSDGSDLGGWLRLTRSYAMLGEGDKARQALANARESFKANPDALRQLDDLARSLGLPVS